MSASCPSSEYDHALHLQSFLRFMNRQFSLLLLACVSAIVLVSTGCDTSVDMVRSSNHARYSLYGSLDVSADTQVIRVEPLGDSTQLGAPEEFNGTVVLENLDTGTQVALRDSFMAVGNGTKVHNFWTTHSIQSQTSYRVRVDRNGETQTSATTTTPGSPDLVHDSTFYLPCCYTPSPYVRPDKANITFTVTAQNENASEVAAAHVTYPVKPTVNHPNRFDITDSTTQKNGRLQIQIPYKEHLQKLNPNSADSCAGRRYFRREIARIRVAVGGPDWPDWLDASIEELARPNSFSNVKNGHGFLGGAYSETVTVQIRDRPVGAPCPGPSQTSALGPSVVSSLLRPSCSKAKNDGGSEFVRRGTRLQRRGF